GCAVQTAQPGRGPMRRESTVQNLLIAILVAAHVGATYAAEGPFILIDLGTLGGANASYSIPSALNDNGQVVGDSVTPQDEIHAFSWTQAAGIIDLGPHGGNY